MRTTRRDFIKTTAAGAASLTGSLAIRPAQTRAPAIDGSERDLAMEAIDAARRAGASYADVRIGRRRSQSIATRERQVSEIGDSESLGIGVRTLVGGCWGFAATNAMTKAAAQQTAVAAVRIAKAAGTLLKQRVELAPAPPVKGAWMTPVTRDPIDVPLEEKISLLLAANEAALKVKGVRFAASSLSLLREVNSLWTSDGTEVTQTLIRVGPQFTATAIGDGGFEEYSEELAPRGAGWEYIETLDLVGNAERWATIAAEKVTAKPIEAGRYDLILDPTNLWLTIHESIGHPTELDRAIGYEANYAGTSFVAPPEKVLGKLRYGPAFMNVQADRTQDGSLARVAWDDEGVAADRWLIVEHGVFMDYQTTREQVPWIAGLTGITRSHGCSSAESWAHQQFQRMPNISLLPSGRDIGLDDIIADTARGIVVKNRGSWSIDHQRYNFQFSGQVFYEVRNGRITSMLKGVAYQSNTLEFWSAMDLVGGKSSYWLGGTFTDGKGEPSQISAVSHGCPPARFRGINVLNTGAATA